MKTRLRVRDVAEAKGISMTKLHHLSEVAYGTIRKIFHDPYTEITLTTLNRLAAALQVETKELLESVPDEQGNGPTP
jgi:DNA-binding Xre family transcriptional regulator